MAPTPYQQWGSGEAHRHTSSPQEPLGRTCTALPATVPSTGAKAPSAASESRALPQSTRRPELEAWTTAAGGAKNPAEMRDAKLGEVSW